MYNEKQEYVYFLCPKVIGDKNLTNEQLASAVKDIFSAGLIVDDGLTLEDSFVKVRDGMVEECDGGIEEVIDKFLAGNPGVDWISVVKIPKQYLGLDTFDLEEGKGLDLPLPFFLKKKDANEDVRFAITKSLVDGIYCNRFHNYVKNTNYNPAIDPSGLYYTEEQLKAMADIGNNEWYQFVFDRNKTNDSIALREKEREENFWDKYINDYRRLYPLSTTNNPFPILAFKDVEKSVEDVNLQDGLVEMNNNFDNSQDDLYTDEMFIQS